MKGSVDTECIICVGSNCGDRRKNVEASLKWLSGILGDFRHSHIYATPDCHGGQKEYMNAVCRGKTELEASELDSLCKDFEISCGRDSESRAAGNVPIDVDVVVYGEKILRERDYHAGFFRIGLMSLACCSHETVKE